MLIRRRISGSDCYKNSDENSSQAMDCGVRQYRGNLFPHERDYITGPCLIAKSAPAELSMVAKQGTLGDANGLPPANGARKSHAEGR